MKPKESIIESVTSSSKSVENNLDKKIFRKSFKSAYIEALIILLLPILLYGLVGPLEIFIGNIAEFNFKLSDFYIFYAITSVLLLLLGSFILAILPKKIARYFETGIFAVSVLSYIQNMFLNKQLINQDGTSMNWSAMRPYTIQNLIIWIVIFIIIVLLPFVCKKYYVKIFLCVSGFLSALQLVAFIGLLISGLSVKYDDIQYTLSGAKQYQVARGNNVIVFVLDHYSNGTFDNCMYEHPEMTERLKDFTYYDNAESHYSFTFPSLAHLLTGADVDCSMKPDEWKEYCWQSEECNNFYKTLHELGYECNFYSAGSVFGVLGNISYLVGKIDNVIEATPVIDHALLIRLFEKMTVYRNVPYILKPRFETLTPIFDVAAHYEIESGVEYENIAFYHSVQEEGLSFFESAPNGFTVIHLEGTHGLRTTTANAEYTDLGAYSDEDEPTSEETAQGLSIILNAYIDELKRLGVYDSATIIITADHGDGLRDVQPIFFIKEANMVQDTMQINHAPISHDDFLATVLYCIGQDYFAYGTPIMKWQEDDLRERETWIPYNGFYVYSYVGDKQDLIEKIDNEEYSIEGATTGWKHSW